MNSTPSRGKQSTYGWLFPLLDTCGSMETTTIIYLDSLPTESQTTSKTVCSGTETLPQPKPLKAGKSQRNTGIGLDFV